MILTIKHIKNIAYFLAMLILFQSCVVYNRTPSSVTEASRYKERLMKIVTIDGYKYKLNWIEAKNGNIVNMKNTEREYFDKGEICQIVKIDPEPLVIPLDSAVKHRGTMQVLTRNKKGKYISHEFGMSNYVRMWKNLNKAS